MRKAFILSECEPPECDEKPYALLVANPTKGHHFIAQTEQRQNAFNLQVNPQNRNVYQWPLSRFDHHPRGEINSVNIEKNLEVNNLYTLTFVEGDGGQQYNLETWFSRHETGYEEACESLRLLATDKQLASPELHRILNLKILGLLRNPLIHRDYLVRELTGALNRHLPQTGTEFRELIARRPQERVSRILKEFDFTLPGYTDWLADLYGMLSEGVFRPSLFARLTAALTTDPNQIRLILHRYPRSHRYCFFADSGYCLQADNTMLSIGFNIAADMFLILQITRSHWHNLSNLLSETPPPTPTIPLTVMDNQHQQRLTFNRLCIRQAHHAVYGKSNQLSDFL